MQYVTVIPRTEEERKVSIKSLEDFQTSYHVNKNMEGRILPDLSPSFRLLYLFGTFSMDRELSKKYSQCCRFFIQVIENIINAFWIYVFVASALSTISIARQMQTSFTLCLMNVITVIIRFIFYWKKHKIRSTVRAIEQFYDSVTDEEYKPLKNILTVMSFACIISACTMGMICAEHLRVAGTFDQFANDFVFGFNFTNYKANMYFHIFSKTIFTTTIFYHHFLPVSMCIFICSVYVAFKRAITAFSRRINSDILRRIIDIDFFASSYKTMLEVLQRVEDLLSACTFFMYGCLLANQLCVITQIIAGAGQPAQPTSVLMEVSLSIKNVVIFYSITLIGASISQEMDNVRTQIKQLPVESSRDFEKLSLMIQGVCSSPATLTAWKMFCLKRSLILTTGSVMITYSMLLLQFSQQNRG
ncbi:hypothetical protein JTE90_001923 [Oedothorax gibbosus]|uniref:Gustatory receptor n=1 Tax=Oedothorax gibbosus TaxID=931172 RepID=A0AAV6VX44_9ARAC|nr:hypothetical protein JTE90_001923 [Oedothorax gibbosus]